MSGSEHDRGHGDSLLASGVRLVMRPARALAGSVGVEQATEQTVDEILAGPLPEIIGRSIGEHRVIERIVAEASKSDDIAQSIIGALEDERTAQVLQDVLASPAIDKLLSRTLEGGLAREVTDRLLRSPEFERVLSGVLSSPEIRRVLMKQSTSLAGEAAAGMRRRLVPLDTRLHQWVRRLLRRPAATVELPAVYGGFITRGFAFAVDVVLVAVTVGFGTVIANAVHTVFGGHLGSDWVTRSLLGLGWLIVSFVYFVGFWATAGQTPGMRLLGLRVVSWTNADVGFGRAVVRFFGLQLSIVLLFTGFLPALVDARRRTLQDFLARTLVVYDERAVTTD